MPPPWGRPPEGLDPRARREWERRVHEWELSQNRFEELDSDDESVSSAMYAQYMGYEGPSNNENISASAFADLAYGDDYDPDDDHARGAEWQLAMREKEEELAERALRRIRRARLRGDSKVDLSREELDALERRRHRQELERRPTARVAASRQPPPPPPPAAASKAKRKGNSSIRGLEGSPKSKPAKSNRRVATYPHQGADVGPHRDLPPASSSSSLYKLANASPRASRKSSRARLHQPGQPPFYDLPATSNYRPSSSRSSRRGDGSPTRSLPDDPDWVPRSRSSSLAQGYNISQHAPIDRNIDPFSYMSGTEGRRIVSEPTPASQSVTYASVRRNPPRQAQATGVGGRPREIIDISDDDDEDELEGDGDSDEGVRVDVVPDRGGYSVQQAAAAAPTNAGVPRARKGKSH